MKRMITSGVRYQDDEYEFDYESNNPEDIIDMVTPYLEKSSIGNNVYYFGYKFNDEVSSRERTEFIKWIKGLSSDKISDRELKQFIELPLNKLDDEINLYSMDALVYPLSGRSNIVLEIIKSINNFTSRDMRRSSFELVKSIPTDIEFDWDAFDAENKPNPDFKDELNRYNQMKEYIEEELLPRIHKLDYFSIAESVKPKYRRYIKNFISFDEMDIERIKALQKKNILVVDDINTTGSTLNEILRKIETLNNDCNIYVYTLIGK